METITIDLGGATYSVEYAIGFGDVAIYSIQDLNGRELMETLHDESYNEVIQKIKDFDEYNNPLIKL